MFLPFLATLIVFHPLQVPVGPDGIPPAKVVQEGETVIGGSSLMKLNQAMVNNLPKQRMSYL